MKKTLFSGLCTALVTPFLEDRINYPMVDLLIERQVEAGVEAVVLAGTTGESPTLSDDEKIKLFQRGVKAANKGALIIAGTGSNDTRHTIELSKEAEHNGADALLVVTPYYNKTSQKGLVAHYEAIAREVNIPIIVYNVPSRTGMDISTETCIELSHIPNIAGIKEASTDISKVLRLVSACGNNLPVWSGNDDHAVAVMSLGGKGLISVTSNVIPLEMNAMVTAAKNGDFDLAALLQRKLLPLTNLMFCQVNPVPVKAAMKYVGYDVGACRMPLDRLSDENDAKMKAFFRRWNQIS